MQRNIKSHIDGVLENIMIILNSNFYKNEDKNGLEDVYVKMKKWYEFYKEKNSLKGIEPYDLKNMDFDITDFFDKYIATENVKENYAERLLHDFGYLEKEWKKEMLGV